MLFGPVDECVAGWGEAYARLADVIHGVCLRSILALAFYAPPLQGIVLGGLVGFELCDEPGVDLLGDHQHGFALGFACNLLGGLLALVDFDVGATGQTAHGFGVVAAFAFHHPLEHVAVLATSEAMVGLPCLADGERASLLGVEGAAAHEGFALWFQLHFGAYEVNDVDGFGDSVYVDFGDHIDSVNIFFS